MKGMRRSLQKQQWTGTGDQISVPARQNTMRSRSYTDGMAVTILEMQQTPDNQSIQQQDSTRPDFPGAYLTGGARHTFPVRLQAKPAISQPEDQYEQEADRVAEAVMRMPEPLFPRARKQGSWEERVTGKVQRTCAACASGRSLCPQCAEEEELAQRKPLGAQITPLVQRQTTEEPEEEDDILQAKEDSAGSRSVEGEGEESAPPIVHEVLRSPGQPLDPANHAFFAPRFGHDFSRVRIHTDARAAESARAVNALAYTVGQDVVFGAGQYAPGTAAGNRLLAHELTHAVQQETDVVRRQDDACTTRFRRAHSFPDFINLVREAETRLSAAGYTSVEDRIHVLRGIYYGTPWSADYEEEHSTVRNLGFQVYTASTTPDDPRPHLNCGLFEALRNSQDLIDGRRRVDVGHLFIGLDARRNRIARNVTIPTQGGTGLDISTWLGDLGGGAAMLAYRRVSDPSTSAMNMFRGTDFGGPINLEGDVAGFVVARDTSTTPSEPAGLTFAGSSTIADALADYLLPTTSGATSSEWNNRCRTFMQMKGATLNTSGALTNRTTLISQFKVQIEQFACWYLVNRMRQTGRLSLSILRTASLHISGASEEIATIFVDALNACQSTPGSNLAATGSSPAPSAIGTGSPTACNVAIRTLETAEDARDLLERGAATWHNLERRARELRELIPF